MLGDSTITSGDVTEGDVIEGEVTEEIGVSGTEGGCGRSPVKAIADVPARVRNALTKIFFMEEVSS
jgi:hypothetical protein